METFKSDSILLKQAVLGLEDGLIESPRYNVVKSMPKRNLPGFQGDLSIDLNWRLLSRICPDSTDLLIELVAANFKDTVIPIWESKIHWQNYYCILSTFYWRLYEYESGNTRVFRIKDTVRIEERSSDDYSKETSATRLIDNLKFSSYQAGLTFATGIAPTWKEIDRIYYKFLIPAFYTADNLVKKGDWKGAAEKWRPLTLSKNKVIASRACFNMAVAAEMSDHFDLSLEWINMSKKLGMKLFVDEYASLISERINQKAKLDIQFGRLD